jgi:SAM-dependent methyltransferase
MKTEAAFWDAIAEGYAAKPVSNPEAYARKLVITKERLRDDQRILDVGCGTGSLALELAPHVAQVDALDISPAMIEICRRKAEAANIANATFHAGTLDDALPFADASFDGVCAYNILHLVADRPTALARLFALAKPGAFFISSTACLGDTWVPFRLILPVMRWVGKAPPVQVFGVDTLLQEIRTAGFDDIETPDVGADATTAFVVATKPR